MKGTSPKHHWRLGNWSRHHPVCKIFQYFSEPVYKIHKSICLSTFSLFSSQRPIPVWTPGYPLLGSRALMCSYELDMIIKSVWGSQLDVISKSWLWHMPECQLGRGGGFVVKHVENAKEKDCWCKTSHIVNTLVLDVYLIVFEALVIY